MQGKGQTKQVASVVKTVAKKAGSALDTSYFRQAQKTQKTPG